MGKEHSPCPFCIYGTCTPSPVKKREQEAEYTYQLTESANTLKNTEKQYNKAVNKIYYYLQIKSIFSNFVSCCSSVQRFTVQQPFNRHYYLFY
jgi:hypothetical protein